MITTYSTMGIAEPDTDAVCRICLEPGMPLLSPCDCAGTMRWVHPGCLREWHLKGPRRASERCELCGAAFKMTTDDSHRLTALCLDVVRASTVTRRTRRRNAPTYNGLVMFSVSSHFLAISIASVLGNLAPRGISRIADHVKIRYAPGYIDVYVKAYIVVCDAWYICAAVALVATLLGPPHRGVVAHCVGVRPWFAGGVWTAMRTAQFTGAVVLAGLGGVSCATALYPLQLITTLLLVWSLFPIRDAVHRGTTSWCRRHVERTRAVGGTWYDANDVHEDVSDDVSDGVSDGVRDGVSDGVHDDIEGGGAAPPVAPMPSPVLTL